MIRAVLFDLDGTLLDRDTSVQQFVAGQHQRLADHLAHIPKQHYISRWVELDCNGHVWKDKVYKQLVAEFAIVGLSWQQLLDDYDTRFMLHCVPFRGMIDMLSVLNEQGYSLGVITNGLYTFQTRILRGLGIQSFFKAVLISEAEQVRKPQPEIFHRAVQRLGTSGEHAVFVGDHPEADICGAKGAGLKAIWKRNLVWSKPNDADAIIDELNELPAVVRWL